jgi:hypothetical protein
VGTPDPDLETRFTALQARLRPLDEDLDPGRAPHTAVVLPSLNVDPGMLARHAASHAAFEERFLYLLLLLRRPHVRIVFVSSRPVPGEIVDAYLDLMPELDRSRLGERLEFVSADEDTVRPLAEKLLDRPDLQERLRALVPDEGHAFLAPYRITDTERDLALRLDLPVYCPDQRFYEYGTKRGGRRLFAEEGVPHPVGVEGVRDAPGLVAGIREIRAARPGVQSVVAKLNDTVYGEGNVILAVGDLPEPGSAEEAAAVKRLVGALPGPYLRGLAEDPGIVEEMIVGEEVRSPSIQMRIIAGGEAGLAATHDQILGGAAGQTFVGCTFPADAAYAPAIAREAEKVRARLIREGAVGRFGVDFVVARDGEGEWRPYAVEINMREGGTTHPFGTLWMLTGGTYDAETATYTSASGREKAYVATDDLESPAWIGLEPGALLAAAAEAGLAYDPATETGVVFHMLRTLKTEGRLGLTAIAETVELAQEVHDLSVALLDRLAA